MFNAVTKWNTGNVTWHLAMKTRHWLRTHASSKNTVRGGYRQNFRR